MEKKYFEIRGYDSNFDLGGSHVEPLLAIVYGTEEQARKYAETLPRFRSGKYIVGGVYEWKQTIVDLDVKLKNKPIYTHCSEELNDKVAELMDDFNKLVAKAKKHGLDIRLFPESDTLVLYFNDDYPDTLLVDKALSNVKKYSLEEVKKK